ncbi:DUF7793 family protein [Arthrobacter sp. HLT1-21]
MKQSRNEPRFQLDRSDDGVSLVRWDDSLVLTAEDILALIEEQQAQHPGVTALLLADLNGMVTLSRDAFALLATSLNVSAVAAFGTSPVERVLIEHFRAVHRPPYPIEYFESAVEARIWLHEIPFDNSPPEHERHSEVQRHTLERIPPRSRESGDQSGGFATR